MKIYVEGEKSRALCAKCKTTVATEFVVASVPLSKSKTYVDDVLVAKCQECGAIVGIPQQSVPRIKEVVSRKYSVEVRIPIHLRDILILATEQLQAVSPDALVRYYICLAAEDNKLADAMSAQSSVDFAKGASYRYSLKINDSVQQKLLQLLKRTKLSKTQLLKGLILQINREVLQRESKKRIQELERVLIASA